MLRVTVSTCRLAFHSTQLRARFDGHPYRDRSTYFCVDQVSWRVVCPVERGLGVCFGFSKYVVWRAWQVLVEIWPLAFGLESRIPNGRGE